MSRAFTREQDPDAAATADVLPDRPLSSHPNFVTVAGLAAIDATLLKLGAQRAQARERGDARELAVIARDLRYWNARRASARVIESELRPRVVRFGVLVTLRHRDGSQRLFRIVGEDEADPTAGTISFVSPVAQQLLGAGVGDTLMINDQHLEVVALAPV